MKKRILPLVLFALLFFFNKAHAQYTVVLVPGTPGSSQICSETTVTLVATTNYTGSVQGYTWVGSSFAFPIFQPSIVVGPGTYTVIGGSAQGIFLGPHYFTVGPCTGIPDTDSDFRGLVLFPNPVKDFLYLRLEDLAASRIHLEVSEITGRLIISEPDFDLENGVDLSSFEPGVYVVTLRSGELRRRFKVVKE